MPTDTASFLTKNTAQRYTLGIVYEPNVLDTDDEFAPPEVIEKACWNFMMKMQGCTMAMKQSVACLETLCKAMSTDDPVRVDITELLDAVEKGWLGDMHQSWDDDVSRIVECYIAPVDMTIGDEHVSKGSWLMGVVWSEEAFTKILNGDRTGYSMGGVGTTIDAEIEEVRHAG